MKTIAVFFGGNSNEREISVITGLMAVNLLWEKARVVPVYIAQDGTFYSSSKMRAVEDFRNFSPKAFPAVALEGKKLVFKNRRRKTVAVLDCALNCCHGGMGEDGTLSAILSYHGVPFASPDAAVSSVFMDKALGKIAARGLGIPVVEGFSVNEEEWDEEGERIKEQARKFGYPLIVKPCKLGSSIGICVAKSEEELEKAFELAFRLDEKALVERYLSGKRDINCAAYRSEGKVILSAPEEVFSGDEILSFSEKYEGTGTRKSEFPASLPEGIAEKIQAYTQTVYENFGICGVVRADFLVAGDEVYFNELNTVPGSLACYLFGESLLQAREFLFGLTNEAKAPKKRELLSSGILERGAFSGGKGAKG